MLEEGYEIVKIWLGFTSYTVRNCIDFIVCVKILADAMGLGKTIMTLSLLLTHLGRGGSVSCEYTEANGAIEQSPDSSKEVANFAEFNRLLKRKNNLLNGGSLIVCPMTLLGQWKVSFVTYYNGFN